MGEKEMACDEYGIPHKGTNGEGLSWLLYSCPDCSCINATNVVMDGLNNSKDPNDSTGRYPYCDSEKIFKSTLHAGWEGGPRNTLGTPRGTREGYGISSLRVGQINVYEPG